MINTYVKWGPGGNELLLLALLILITLVTRNVSKAPRAERYKSLYRSFFP